MCSTTTVDGLDDQVQHVEDLVLLRKHGEAAVAASALLRGFASRPCEAQTLQRCALAALHAHIYGGRCELRLVGVMPSFYGPAGSLAVRLRQVLANSWQFSTRRRYPALLNPQA